MTGPTPESRLPGRLLLKLAYLMFDEPALSTIVSPALADLQQEVRDAGHSRISRLLAHARGCVAFWKLVATCLVAIPVFDVRRSPMMTIVPARTGGRLLAVLSLVLFAAIWPVFGWFSVAALVLGVVLATGLRAWNNHHPGAPSAADPLLVLSATALLAALWSMFGWFVAATIVGGVLMAVTLRRWNTLHPSRLARANETGISGVTPDARINMSSIPVAGDFGGLMFVVGAFVIMLLGLPDIRWFVLGSVVVGTAMASGLFFWRSSHQSDLSMANSILRR